MRRVLGYNKQGPSFDHENDQPELLIDSTSRDPIGDAEVDSVVAELVAADFHGTYSVMIRISLVSSCRWRRLSSLRESVSRKIPGPGASNPAAW